MENVPQLYGSPEYEAIRGAAAAAGFETAAAILCAADYGVPQTRYRTIIVGARDIDPHDFFPPLRTHRQPHPPYHRRLFNGIQADYVEDPNDWLTVADAVGSLPAPVGTEPRDEPAPLDLHFHRNPTPVSMRRYRAVPAGGNRFDLPKRLTPGCWIRKTSGGTDLFGRLWWDRPSVTMRTEFFKPEKGRYLHPDQDRPITHREAARLQWFPDEFRFVGTKIEIAKQIGNAVPRCLPLALPTSSSRSCSQVADKWSKEQRSALMARVRQRNTAPELIARRLLHAQGYRFRLHVRALPGTPDIVLKRHRKIVFVHGCFWHGHEGCRKATLPQDNHDWWAAKIEGNRRRDAVAIEELRRLGWDVLVVWECETKHPESLDAALSEFMTAEAI